MHRIYKKKEYVIYKADGGFVVQNIRMKGFAHTHLESLDCAHRIVGLSVTKKLPHNLSRYMLVSLLRVNDDTEYIEKVNELLANKKKKDTYRNNGFYHMRK